MTVGKPSSWIDPTITLGNVMNTVAIAMFLAPIMWKVLDYAHQADSAEKEAVKLQGKVVELQGQVKEQFSILRTETGENLKSIKVEIANLPMQAARLDQAEKQIGELKQGIRELGDRLAAVHQTAIEGREAIKRLDQTNPPVRATQGGR